MTDNPILLRNCYGGYYAIGRSFGREKWYGIADFYDNILEAHGSVIVSQLVEVAHVLGRLAETAKH